MASRGGRIGREAMERAEDLVKRRAVATDTPEPPDEGPSRPEPIKRHL